MYTIEDIDVFVMTHNRAAFLKETLDCLMIQSVRPDHVTVFDNESIDDTEAIVRSYADCGVRYVRTMGRDGNFFEMQKRATRSFVVHFHDDNLFHREYLEKVLYVLNSVEGVAGVTGAYQYFEYSSDPNYIIRHGPRLLNRFLILSNAGEFVVHKVRSETRPQDLIVDNIGALVYRTDYFKKRVSLNWKYGKADDTEVFISLLNYGRLVTISDWQAVFVRQHSNRDVNNDETSLSLEQALNWVELYVNHVREVESVGFWRDFLGMLYTQYPYFIKRSVFVELPTMDFLEMLVRERYVPAVCKTALEEFRAGKQPLVSGGALIWANRAESVARARWRSTIRSPFRRIRKVIKWVMPYAVVRIVQKIQDRVRFGKPA